MRFKFVLLGLLAFVCATSGYVLKDQDDALGDTDDRLERVVFEDDDGDRAEQSDFGDTELWRNSLEKHGHEYGSHSHEHYHHTHKRRTSTTTTTTPTTTTKSTTTAAPATTTAAPTTTTAAPATSTETFTTTTSFPLNLNITTMVLDSSAWSNGRSHRSKRDTHGYTKLLFEAKYEQAKCG
nr:integumentary mucin C.1-like [Procambarus clarkii]